MQQAIPTRRRFVLDISALGLLTAVLIVLVVTLAVGDSAALAAASDRFPVEPASQPVAAARQWEGSATSPSEAGRRLAPLTISDATPTIRIGVSVDDVRQTWTGVGGALTDSSVELLSGNRQAIDLLFDGGLDDGAHLNLVRLPLSATDFSDRAWTWTSDDVESEFRPTPEAERAVDVLNDITDVHADTSVFAAAWTAPATLLDDDGGLARDAEAAYVDLIDAQVDWLQGESVPVRSVTLGNEPGNLADYPSMTMTNDQMVRLGEMVKPGLERRDVDLWALDHNWADRPRVDALLAASPGTFDAAAFHCYDGTPDQMAGLTTPVVVTECTGTDDNWTSTFGWDARVLVAESINAGSTGLLMWNLALSPDPDVLPGGCSACRGLLTIDPTTGSVTPTPEYFTLAHLARAADPGAAVVSTEHRAGLSAAAFVNPDGTVGIFGHNDSGAPQVVEFELSDGDRLTVEVGPWEMFSVRG